MDHEAVGPAIEGAWSDAGGRTTVLRKARIQHRDNVSTMYNGRSRQKTILTLAVHGIASEGTPLVGIAGHLANMRSLGGARARCAGNEV